MIDYRLGSYIQRADSAETKVTYVVLGPPRGGTSAISGLLRIFGIYMGECVNTFHEDPEFLRPSNELPAVIRVIKERNASHSVWGWKAPDSIFWLKDVRQYLRNPRFILVLRHPLETGRSQQKHSGSTVYLGTRVTLGYLTFIHDFIEHEDERRILLVSYEDLITNKRSEIERIAEFCDVTLSELQLEQALKFLTPNGYRTIA